jgi:membrane protease YdiL (CAAX protease family)
MATASISRSSVTAPTTGIEVPGATLPFFAAAFGITWALQLPVLLAMHGLIAGPVERFMLPAGLGMFGPLLAALLASRFSVGAGGGRALLARLCIWRMNPGWYLVALGLLPATYVVAAALYALLGGTGAHTLYPPENAAHIAAMIVAPIGEEPGWRGFALPRMQARYGALNASLLLGVAWALWHTLMFLGPGMTSAVFALSLVNIVVGSVVFSWIYNRTRGSLLLAILAHVGAHLNNPAHALPGNATPMLIQTAALAVLALALVLGDRSAWRGAAS